MVQPLHRLLLIILVVVLALILIWLNILSWRGTNPSGEKRAATQPAWQEKLDWQAGQGALSDGWGWGNLQFETDYLELQPRRQATAAYVFPTEHAADFVLAAEIMVPDGASDQTRLHLMTRDRGAANNVSGCVLTADSDTLFVQHVVNATEHLLTRVPNPIPLRTGRWHRLRLTCAAGSVSLMLDGEEIFYEAGPYPPGLYAEPYIAAESGVVRIREFKVLAGPWGGQ